MPNTLAVTFSYKAVDIRRGDVDLQIFRQSISVRPVQRPVSIRAALRDLHRVVRDLGCRTDDQRYDICCVSRRHFRLSHFGLKPGPDLG